MTTGTNSRKAEDQVQGASGMQGWKEERPERFRRRFGKSNQHMAERTKNLVGRWSMSRFVWGRGKKLYLMERRDNLK